MVEGVRNEGGGKGSKPVPASPLHPTPLAPPSPRRGVERARSPSPLGCRALNGWRSAAPPRRVPQPQVRGAPSPRSRRARGPCTLLHPFLPYTPPHCAPHHSSGGRSPPHAPGGLGAAATRDGAGAPSPCGPGPPRTWERDLFIPGIN